MKRKINDFPEIEILKERQRIRILEQEMRLKSGFRELSGEFTGAALINRLRENLFSGSGLAFKLGFMAVSILTDRLKRKRTR